MARTNDSSTSGLAARFEAIRIQARDAIKWWAEHQSWPATDEIRIDRRPGKCC